MGRFKDRVWRAAVPGGRSALPRRRASEPLRGAHGLLAFLYSH